MYGSYRYGQAYYGRGPALTPNVVGPIPPADGLFLRNIRARQDQFQVTGRQAGLTVRGTQNRLSDVEGE